MAKSIHSPKVRRARNPRYIGNKLGTGFDSKDAPSKEFQSSPVSLYGGQFSAEELDLIEYLQASDLSAEISMLRVAIRRVFETASAAGRAADLEENSHTAQTWMEVLDKLGMASSRLAGLLRAQQALTMSRSDEISEALSQALAEITKEMKLE